MLLKDKTAIITGGGRARGIGRACAELFAEHGCRVAVLDLNADWAKDAAAKLTGGGHIAAACDVTDPASCAAAVEKVLAAFGHVDILVNNAGISQKRGIMDVTEADYDAVLGVNLRGTFNMSQALIPHMRSRRQGSIINLASVSGQRGGGIFGGPHYAAAKAGVSGLTKAIARELAPDNVRANAINPGLVDTDITKGPGGLTDAQRAAVIEAIPMRRAGEAREVAGCALFLASDLAPYMTGSELDLNGGSHIH